MNEEEDSIILKHNEKSNVSADNIMMQMSRSTTEIGGRSSVAGAGEAEGSGSAEGLGPGGWGRRLLVLARAGDAAGVARLAAAGAPLAADWLGAGPLHLAARGGHRGAAAELLRAGARSDARTKLDRTPLHLAAYHGHLDVLQLLLEAGANVDMRDMLGMTALHWAAEHGHLSCCSALLGGGADPHLTSKFLKTPLQLAARNPQLLHHMMEIIAERESRAATTAFEVEQEQEPQIEEIHTSKTKTTPEQHEKKDNKKSKIEAAAGGLGAAMLRAHGITLLPTEPGGGTALSALRAGRSVVLSDAGRLMLNESVESTRIAKPMKVVKIHKDVKIAGIKRPAAAMENINTVNVTGNENINQTTTGTVDIGGDATELDMDDGGKAPQVKIIMNRANFNKLVATATRIHSPERQQPPSGPPSPPSAHTVVVPARFVRSRDPHYLRSQLLCAHAALGAARADLRRATETIRRLAGGRHQHTTG